MNEEQQNAPELTELETVKAQAEEYLSGWRRAQADYANLKKRTNVKNRNTPSLPTSVCSTHCFQR
jgi:molecular chaperone GrpE (heat shock protein)